MKKTVTKKKIIGASLLGTGVLLVFLYLIFYSPCSTTSFQDKCYQLKHNLLNPALPYLFIFLSLFLLSLITYKMRDEVFRAWWNFARWWVPVIILVTYLLSTQSGGGGLGIGGAMSSAVDVIILGFFYAVLIIVSLWRIIKKYRQLKRVGK